MLLFFLSIALLLRLGGFCGTTAAWYAILVIYANCINTYGLNVSEKNPSIIQQSQLNRCEVLLVVDKCAVDDADTAALTAAYYSFMGNACKWDNSSEPGLY